MTADKKRISQVFVAGLGVLLAGGLAGAVRAEDGSAGDLAPGPALQQETRLAMGGQATVTLVGVGPERSRRAFDAAFAQFERVDLVMNEWREDSPLSALNRAAGRPGYVSLPEDLCSVLRLGLEGAAWTGGAFDPSWAALRGLWRFDGEARVPDPAEVSARCARVGYRGLAVRARAAGGCEARLARPGMQLGLGGVAKGWGVDRAVEALRSLGLRDFVVQAGGDLYAAGTRDGRPWRLGIRDPRGPADERFAVLEVSDAAFSTSGDYEHFFEVEGRRYHHLIDPRTCYPAQRSRSATVLAASAVEAEILTKAVFVVGGEVGIALAERRGASAVLVTSENRVIVSPRLAGRLSWRAPSPDSAVRPLPKR